MVSVLFYQMTEEILPGTSSNRGGEAGEEAGSQVRSNNDLVIC